jgi:integrase
VKDGLSASAGSRDLGNMRVLHTAYFRHIGEPDRPNPFDGLSFKKDRRGKRKVRAPFAAEWIRDKLLDPANMQGLNRDARLIFLALIETGCRPSEVCNLTPGDIVLDVATPHLKIRHRAGREIKTESSERDVPLVGVSLAAMKLAPNGFPRYADREDTLSAVLMKHLRRRDLLPTADHYVYSLRHSFEDRLENAGVDYEIRMDLMGHGRAARHTDKAQRWP